MEHEEISALSAFLEYGPIGLAGLMLVLTIIAMSVGDLTESRASLLKFYLAIGATCFLSTLVFEYLKVDGEHKLVLFVAPHDVKQNQDDFPPPAFNVNGDDIDRKDPILISTDSQVRVDVSAAIGLLNVSEAQIQKQEKELVAQKEELINREANLKEKSVLLEAQEDKLNEQSDRISAQRKAIVVQRSELERREEAMFQAQETLEMVSARIERIRQEQLVQSPNSGNLFENLQEELMAPMLLLQP